MQSARSAVEEPGLMDLKTGFEKVAGIENDMKNSLLNLDIGALCLNPEQEKGRCMWQKVEFEIDSDDFDVESRYSGTGNTHEEISTTTENDEKTVKK